MKHSRSNLGFWVLVGLGILLVTTQSVALYGFLAIPLGIGTGASLGMVVYYLGDMIWSGALWLREQLKRP